MNLTAKDMQETVLRYLGGTQVNAETVIDSRSAINDALKELWGEHEWPWYQGQTAMQLDDPYRTGTVTYDSSTRRFTLTGGTWPTWAVYGSIRIETKDARVTERVSDTIIEIEDGTPFTDTFASATSYTLYRNEYPVPGNIRKISYVFFEQNAYTPLKYLPSLEFRTKMPGSVGSVPIYFTIQKDRQALGGLVIVFWPYPTRAYSARFSYIRCPGDVNVWEESTGKITVANSSTTVNGTNTAFDPILEGALLRVGKDIINLPTNRMGTNPFSEETMIKTYTSSTVLECQPAIVYPRTNVKFVISSLLDIDETIMSSAFTQQCYFEIAKRRKFDDKAVASIDRARTLAVRQAMSKCAPVQELSYAGSFNNLAQYAGVWFNIGL